MALLDARGGTGGDVVGLDGAGLGEAPGTQGLGTAPPGNNPKKKKPGGHGNTNCGCTTTVQPRPDFNPRNDRPVVVDPTGGDGIDNPNAPTNDPIITLPPLPAAGSASDPASSAC